MLPSHRTPNFYLEVVYSHKRYVDICGKMNHNITTITQNTVPTVIINPKITGYCLYNCLILSTHPISIAEIVPNE